MISVEQLIKKGKHTEEEIEERIWQIEKARKNKCISTEELANLAGISWKDAWYVKSLVYDLIDEEMIVKLEKAMGLKFE